MTDGVAAAYDDWMAAHRDAAVLLRDAAPVLGPVDAAEAYRYLSRLAATAQWMFVEHGDPMWPTLYRNTDEHKKFGIDNPDNVYLRCALRGDQSYRIWGNRGEAPYLGVTVGAEFYGSSRDSRGTIAQHHLDEWGIALGDDFELALSPERPAGHDGPWIRLDPDAAGMILRQTFFDRRTQRAAELHVERLGGTDGAVPEPLDPESVAEQLGRAAAFLRGVTKLFLVMYERWAAAPNTLIGASGRSTANLHADPDIFYVSGAWRLAADEALVLEVTPAAEFVYWGFQLTNRWLESFDYRTLPNVSTNNGRAARNADGTWTLVVAHTDPGVPNWITTAGHDEGAMCFRWLCASDDPPLPVVRVAKIEESRR